MLQRSGSLSSLDFDVKQFNGKTCTFVHGCMQDTGHVNIDVIPAVAQVGDICMPVIARKP